VRPGWGETRGKNCFAAPRVLDAMLALRAAGTTAAAIYQTLNFECVKPRRGMKWFSDGG